MPSTKLTARFVERAPIPQTGQVEYWDTTLRGFGLRVSYKGAKAWFVVYRVHGKKTRYTLPKGYPAQSLVDAREAAGKAMQAVARGEDPATDKKRAREEFGGERTLQAVGDVFVERYAKANQPGSWRETQRILKKNVYPTLGHFPIASVRKADVLDLLDKLGDELGPMAARNAHKALRKLFRWSHEDRDYIEANPIAGLKPPARDVKRERVLTDDEIRALWKLWDSAADPYFAACKVMLLTGQRVHEVSKMRRDEIDARGDWTIAAERYKTRITHIVPLSSAARAIVGEQDSIGTSPLVFTLSGEALNGWSNAKERMDRESGVAGWQLRDLRRTARTLMTRHGVDFFIAERVIGHVIGGVAAVYERYSYIAEKRAALEKLAHAVADIVAGKGNVVPLRAKA